MTWLAGTVFAGITTLAAWGIHGLFPVIPLLTAAVALGILVAQLPFASRALSGVLAPGLRLAARRFMRLGIVLLGLQLSLADIIRLGWLSITSVIAVLLITFVLTLWLGKLLGLPGHQPLLIATGFSICGASAIGAMSGVVKAKDEETATPIALVTLCGTLAIAVLPALWHPLGLSASQFGHWVGASVHDVGQVVATAQVAGSTALAIAIIVKLTRVIMLAPMVAIASTIIRRREGPLVVGAKRPPIVPLFVACFILAILVRSFLPIPTAVLDGVSTAQTALLGMALVGLGATVQLKRLIRTGWRALVVALVSWGIIAALAYAAVQLA